MTGPEDLWRKPEYERDDQSASGAHPSCNGHIRARTEWTHILVHAAGGMYEQLRAVHGIDTAARISCRDTPLQPGRKAGLLLRST